jgi:hypothetical protein
MTTRSLFHIDRIKPLEYYGRLELERDEKVNLEYRKIAFDFSGESELFIIQYQLLKQIESSIPRSLLSIRVEPGRKIEDYTSHHIRTLIHEINEKFTQLLAITPSVLEQSKVLDEQIKRNSGKVFNFYQPIRILESHIEHFCTKVISILDLYAALAHVFNTKCPKKFGQQIAKTNQNKFWDKCYQNNLMSYTALIALRDYRNKLSHEVSLKIRPAMLNGVWVTILVGSYLDQNGFLLLKFLNAIYREILEYAKFFDNYFSQKVPRLKKYVKENRISET